MALEIPDYMLDVFLPSIVYWVYSGFCTVLGMWFKDYKLHTKQEEDEKNRVPKSKVIKHILSQQALHASLLYLGYKLTEGNAAGASKEQQSSFFVIAGQFVVAMVVFDTYQYFLHRLLHQNKFLYRNFHARHHRIIVPYAFGAFYNDIPALFFVVVGGLLSVVIAGMSRRTSTYFLCFTIIKLVDDHSGVWYPGNPFHIFFPNNTAFHDIHHQLCGNKYNFSEPFFVAWDKILGTYMPYAVEKRAEGGFQVRPIRESKDK